MFSEMIKSNIKQFFFSFFRFNTVIIQFAGHTRISIILVFTYEIEYAELEFHKILKSSTPNSNLGAKKFLKVILVPVPHTASHLLGLSQAKIKN